ncbi:ImmA/IrrE family metallo-endopeptidase [Lentzea tibetensis]|uniref:ImmA/IrrE family metallo-endopeptidase n=1 Tax=Lentzea tibetensis TaxID=2591470 RepID=UPI001C998C58|nr:ImmA/IrrE family metallo-endopeptidase [Lentzea tibetensis]
MGWRDADGVIEELVALLPALPDPWDVGVLCERLSEQRGRPLLLHPIDLPALPFGLWYDDGDRDHVLHRSGVTGYHRDHVVLHEICHMLARHNTVRAFTFEDLVENAARNRFDTRQEEVAELFASRVLRTVGLRRPMDEVERRASEVFGAV